MPLNPSANAQPAAAMETRPQRMTSLPLTLRLVVLLLALLVAIVFSLMSGAFEVQWSELVGWQGRAQGDPLSQHILLHIRLPRVLLGVAAGACLGVAGAVMQALFRNPLAEPGLVGLSAGASLGAVLAIVLTRGGLMLIGGFAFLGGLGATSLAYALGKHVRGHAGLLLAGIAINSIVFGAMGILILQANDVQLRDLTFWSMGSLAAADWFMLKWLLPCLFLLLLLLLWQWRVLNALLLGEREAFHLGCHPSRTRWILITLVALTVSPIVAVTGGIGFIGLVVPHLVRLWQGADHRWVLPASGIAGALALTLADCVARSVIAPAELPIGLVTSLIGGPFFVWLLIREART